jgi:uncharacterized protein (TIGR02246 family)
MIIRRVAFVFYALALLMSSVGAAGSQTAKKPISPEAEIRAALESTAAGWNNGDLSQYLAAYAEGATEMLSTGPAGGRSAIEKTMREGFWKSGRPLQKLRYEHLDVRMLGYDHALVTGQFILSGADKPDRSGWFTTVWQRTKDGWRMIHDHS